MSISKTEYLKCGFSSEEAGGEEVAIGGVAISRAKKFRHLVLITMQKGDIDEDINQPIRVRCKKWRNAFVVLCDKNFYRIEGDGPSYGSRQALLYHLEC